MIKHSSHQSPVDSPEASSPPPSGILSPDQEALSDAQARSGVLIGWILQGGVMLSAAVIIIGLLLEALRPDKFAPQKLQFFPQTFEQVWTGLLILRPQAVIAFGLLLLIATPVVRVAASIVAFAVERDRRFVVVTALVLLILLFSIFYVGPAMGVGQHQPFQHGEYSWVYPVLIFVGSIAAGLLGSLVGLGGGVLIVPLLTLVFGFPIYFAIGASIISVIATSSGAAAAYVKDHITNLRVGMFLELATTTGAICGAFLAGLLAPEILSVIFGIILLVSAAPLIFRLGEELPQRVKNDRWANWLRLNGSYPDHLLHREVSYQVTRTPLGLAMMYIAGLISGLLGIGSGTFKVLALDVAMRLPMKVSTTTSNFMIGVTAAASAGIYFSRGDIPPLIAAPVALGILGGALVGARLLAHLSNRILRIIFLVVIAVAAVEMVLRGLGIA
jgi:uncharacterized membrane protein YfcA/uncharacterized membrane protein